MVGECEPVERACSRTVPRSRDDALRPSGRAIVTITRPDGRNAGTARQTFSVSFDGGETSAAVGRTVTRTFGCNFRTPRAASALDKSDCCT